jgi:hypothetical protein
MNSGKMVFKIEVQPGVGAADIGNSGGQGHNCTDSICLGCTTLSTAEVRLKTVAARHAVVQLVRTVQGFKQTSK